MRDGWVNKQHEPVWPSGNRVRMVGGRLGSIPVSGLFFSNILLL